MTYWLNLFTVETWNEFKQAGGHVSGHTESRWTRAAKVSPGDKLLCYLAGAGRWVGVLKVVVGQPFYDDSEEGRVWAKAIYPSRLPVEIELELTPETAIPVKEMIDDLEAFQGLDSPERSWGTLFLGSLNKWSDHDGKAIEAAIADANARPVSRPLPRAALRRAPAAVPTESGPVTIPDDSPEQSPGDDGTNLPDTGSEHTWAQIVLARIGAAMGYDVYVPLADRHRSYSGERLGDQLGIVDRLSLPLIPAAQRIIENIDVLWLDRDAVQAAFEVEKTTAIYSGILRMTDLLALQPNLEIDCFLVAPDDRQQQVVQQVNRPTFARMRRPFADVCRFISFSALQEEEARGDRSWRHQRFSYVAEELAESVALSDL
jgi:hypothetical protein